MKSSLVPLPDKKYQIIYADPPWQYRDKALAGNRGACCKYKTQSLEWVKSLPVQNIADENCILFFWTTMPQLPNAFDVIKSWGFTYKTVGFNWVKRNKKADSWFWGMGGWSRANAELCLIAIKGKPKRISASVHQIVTDRVKAHSEKPDTVRKRIVELMGDIPRIELFARHRTPGWDVWGDEV
jgi:N6-adenosine-specific RNA methylase IME4